MRQGAAEEVAVPAIQLAADSQAPAEAREFIASILDGAPDEVRARACQVASELVTNSVRHSHGTELTVEAIPDGNGGLDIEVRDAGPGFELPPRVPGHAGETGWGLVFVDMLADSWAAGGTGTPVVSAHFEPRAIGADEVRRPDPREELLDLRILLDSVKDYAVFALDRDGRVTLWNSGGERLTGYASHELLGVSLEVLYGGAHVIDELATALAHGRYEREHWMYRKDGSRFWADSVMTPILGASGALRGFAVIARDATWRKRLDDERDELIVRIRHMAQTDDLTALPNRRRWHEELDREMARSRRSGKPLCVAQIDLDGCKAYNDEHGHIEGDKLLARTARAWSDAVRTTDTLGRTGGDEFSLLLPECAVEEATDVVDRLRRATPEPVTCSAGVACSEGTEAPEALVRRADRALYMAKRSGRDVTASG
jgi:diguanylate cyclase (GGDEF)-like protein/PAS domain S-box-containing protein